MARDHYIPQFYLKNFEIPTRRGWIYSYKRKIRPIPKAIRSIAYEEDYYDLKTPIASVPVDNVDKLLQQTEDSASPIIRKLLRASSFSLTDEEFGNFIWFVSLMAFRTPFSCESLAAFTAAWTDKEFKKFAEDKDAFMALGQKPDSDEKIEAREQARQALLSGELLLNLNRGGQTEDFLMRTQLEQADTFVNILERKCWHLIETDCSRTFITSDHPVVLIPSPYHRFGMRVGNLDGWFIFPLSPRRALLLANERLTNRVVPIKRDKMIEYQWYIITRCHLSIFSHLLSKEFQQILDQTEEGELMKTLLPDE